MTLPYLRVVRACIPVLEPVRNSFIPPFARRYSTTGHSDLFLTKVLSEDVIIPARLSEIYPRMVTS